MSLVARQISLYIHNANVFNPLDPLGLSGNEISDLTYSAVPTYGNIPWYYQSGPEITRGKFYGRRNQEDTVSLMDQGHFEDDYDIRPNAIIQMLTAGPEQYTWFLVVGDATVKNRRANKRKYFLKKTTSPAFASDV